MGGANAGLSCMLADVSGFKFARLLSKVGVAFLALLLLLVPAGVASAARLPQVPPLDTFNRPIDDQAGVLTGDRAELEQAIQSFTDGTGSNFYIITVDDFDGMQGWVWSDATFAASGLNPDDILLAISPGALGYGISTERTLTGAQQASLDGITENSLNAALTDTASWEQALTNVVNAFHNELNPDVVTTPEGNQTVPGAEVPAEAAPEIETNESVGGMPWWGILLIVLASLLALFGLWLLLGKYNEKRLAKRRDNFTLV